MITPLVFLAATSLHCGAQIDGVGPVIHHTLTFPAAGRMVDTISGPLGVTRQAYRIRENDRTGFNADTRLAPDATNVVLVDYSGAFQMIANVNGTIRYATGYCR